MFADRLIARDEWGARPPKRRDTATLSKGQQIHWSAVPGAKDPHTECFKQMRGMQNYHMDTKGWLDIAYNFVVCKHGYIFEGRGFGVRNGAGGSSEANTNYLAICSIAGAGDPIGNNYILAIRDIVSEHDGADVQKPHSFFSATACPGPDLKALAESGGLKRLDEPLPIPVPDPLDLTSVLGLPKATQRQAVAYAQAGAERKGSPYTAAQMQEIVDQYYRWGMQYGVRPDLAIAMSAKETGYWSYGGDVKADQWNFAGIGATGGVPGISFPTIEAGVKAHLLRMRMYASADGSFYDQDVLVRPLPQSYWGKCPNIQDFDGVWAVPGVGYGQSIVDDYLAILLLTPEPSDVDLAPIEAAIDELEAVDDVLEAGHADQEARINVLYGRTRRQNDRIKALEDLVAKLKAVWSE